MSRKKYIKPRCGKADIDTDVVRMISRESFIELLWERLAEARKTNPRVTRKEIFDQLNEKYCDAIGCFRYSSYESFRKRIGKNC